MPIGGLTAQVCRLDPKVGGRLALFCIHRVNWVNTRNYSVTERTVNIILILLLLLLCKTLLLLCFCTVIHCFSYFR